MMINTKNTIIGMVIGISIVAIINKLCKNNKSDANIVSDKRYINCTDDQKPLVDYSIAELKNSISTYTAFTSYVSDDAEYYTNAITNIKNGNYTISNGVLSVRPLLPDDDRPCRHYQIRILKKKSLQ